MMQTLEDHVDGVQYMKRWFKHYILLLIVMFAFPAFAAPGKYVTLKEGKIKEILTGYILERTENLGMEVKVKHIGIRGDMNVPSGEVSYEVMVPDQWEGWGRVNLALIVRVNDHVEKNISVPVEVEALTEMAVTVRPLERGEIVGNSDVVMQKRDIASAPGKICRSLSDVVGKRVKIAMRGNLPVRSDYLERVPLIKSGQAVTIIAENDMMRITAMGKAKNSGAEGDLIMVQNLSSMKEIPARVIDSNSVRVDF
jgi:flagella basal body P-ring formation protein FlgA